MIFELLATLLSLYSFVILARLLLSWVPDLVDPYNPIVQLIRQITDPVLEPARVDPADWHDRHLPYGRPAGNVVFVRYVAPTRPWVLVSGIDDR
ncbi:MAG: YggT family protein [Caldilineaceae bacterium]